LKRDCTQDKNTSRCTCTYDACSRKGLCCECIAYHHRNGELPGCLFPPDAEKTYDRSVSHYLKIMK
jgi:hypothetical protein